MTTIRLLTAVTATRFDYYARIHSFKVTSLTGTGVRPLAAIRQAAGEAFGLI